MAVDIYVKALECELSKMLPDSLVGDVLAILEHAGLLDYKKCKVLVVRQYCNDLLRCGKGKVDSMWLAAERFSCSYEFVRACMYYYKDVDLRA